MKREEIIEMLQSEKRSFCASGLATAIYWLGCFSPEATAEEIIGELTDTEWAFYWASNIGLYKDECAKVFSRSKDVMWAATWAKFIGTHKKEMAEAILRTKNTWEASLWLLHEIPEYEEEMKKLIKEVTGEDYCRSARET